MSENNIEIKKTPFDVFVDGAKKGWGLATSSTIPNIIMAFVIIEILKITGLLALIGVVFGPVMAIFGLPGEAATVLMAAWLSGGGGVGVASSLYASGSLNVNELAIVLPSIFILCSQVQYLGRVLGTAGVQAKYYGVMIGITVVCALLSLLAMRFLVVIFGV